ncbi:unnamed protein product [Phytophthora fragariaefolia]|uniref:Unnamed protein product n=1 Tax=Phytophthora fragariaefolia TaxID=1490495 RepID=A0A9W7D5S5_9STRA|nr:unnamed protein product [Phytophthora fragariaefolia]
MIVTSRPPTTLNAEVRQSGRTAGLRTAAVAETSLTEGSTATPATKALTDVVVSMDRVQHARELTIPPTTVSSVPSLQRRFKLGSPPTETGLVPIGLPQLASPPVDADCVYAFVGESKWLKTQRREEVNEVNTTEIEKERNGSFGGGESDERGNDEWNGGSTEDLVSSVTQTTWHDYQPENVIKLLSGEILGWWSARKFDKRVRMRALIQGIVNDARTGILLDTGANASVISERFAKQLRMREVRDHGRFYKYELWVMDHGAGVHVVLGTDFTRVMGSEDEGIDTEGCRVSTRPSTADTGDEHLGTLDHVPDAFTSLAVGSQRGPTEDGWVEGEIYKRWLAAQPSAVERVPYTTPTKILRRPSESSEGSVADRDDQADCATATTEPSTEMVAEVVHQEEAPPKLTARSDRASEGSEMAQLKVEGAYLAAATVSEDWGDRDAPNASAHPGNDIEFEDYAHELAFLPDLTEAAPTTLDYTGPYVRHPSLSVEQQDRVVKVLKSHERIVISTGNALPPPAYGVVCDIDAQGHPPIKPKARMIPLRHLKQLYELLKGLLKAGLIAFWDSPWASPIVIVLKKNGVDIRLCIDYKMVNSVTAIMEYAMPLVDDLLTDMEKYLWYCSLDAASGFWAVMMAKRARTISSFVCALGHFNGVQMPFGLKNAPVIYQRMIDNALWGFVQPRGGWSAVAERVRTAEAADSADGGPPTATATHSRTRGDMFASNEADQSSLVPVFERRSFVDDICFGGESFDSCLETLDRLLSRFEECWISFRFTKSMFSVHPRLRGYGAALYQVRGKDFGPGGDLSTAKRSFTALQAKVADAPILRHFGRAKEVHVMLFANDWALSTTLMQEHDGVMDPVRFLWTCAERQ